MNKGISTGNWAQRFYGLAEAAAEIIFAAESATPLVTRFARLGMGLTAVLKLDKAAAADQYAALSSP